MGDTIFFDDSETMKKVLGINDANIKYFEHLLDTNILVRGNRIIVEKDNRYISPYFSTLIRLSRDRKEQFDESELFMEWQSIQSETLIEDVLSNRVENRSIIANGKSIYPKSENQKLFISELYKKQIVFGIGPAGTGKTFLACSYALNKLLSGEVKKIILTRPVVEAGESLGYLPGDLSQKLNPYLKPFYDAMEYFISPVQIKRFEESGMLEISPLAYMRGRSITNSVILLDEAQNTTTSQMKMFLTRLGENSQAIITGDITQFDLPIRQKSGLVHAIGLLNGINDISMIHFNSSDCIRSRIVRAIIQAYQGVDDEEK